jgi:hypothetical protein
MAEVTVTAVCLELQKSQNTSPAKRHEYRPASGGRPASEASPMPAGSRYAARTTPATTSARSQPIWYARRSRRPGRYSVATLTRRAGSRWR